MGELYNDYALHLWLGKSSNSMLHFFATVLVELITFGEANILRKYLLLALGLFDFQLLENVM